MVLAPKEGKKSANKCQKRTKGKGGTILLWWPKRVWLVWGDRDKGNMILGRGWSDEERGMGSDVMFPRGKRESDEREFQ
jgi:hypothetical protein